jgi:hypothetical protein
MDISNLWNSKGIELITVLRIARLNGTSLEVNIFNGF